MNFGPQTKNVWAQILTHPKSSYTVSWRKSIRHVVLGYSFGVVCSHCREWKFEYLNWLCTRTCGAGRPHVWLCHAHLVNLISLLLGRKEPLFRTGLYFAPYVFFLFRHWFSELPPPIALKLCHMVGTWQNFINWLKNSGECLTHPKKCGKCGPKTYKISVNFGPLQILIANVSGMSQDIHNRKTLQTIAIPPAFDEEVRWTLVH